MVLMREEAYLLIIKEICQLIECDDLYKIPGDAQQKEYIELEKK